MKSQKPLWKVSVATTLEAEDAFAELLGGTFNGGASAYFDLEKQISIVSIFISRKILREEREEIREGLELIKNCGLKIGAGKISFVKVRREDWANSWKRHFRPIEIGDSLLVKPSWNKKRPKRNQAVVILDPGLSFGTGHHPTTSFCLQEIVRHREAKTSFLDIGTGSGILAIAAAKLGYKPVHAFDFDAEAVRIAKANAKANGVKIKIYRNDVTKCSAKPRMQFELICANLISNLLIAERKKIVAQLKSGGILVLAGILKSEFLPVQKAFENCGMKLVATRTEKEWRSGSFRFVKNF
jgi:ribosomal protein L11 methyltransferase